MSVLLFCWWNTVNLDSRLDKTICFECPPNLLLFLLRCIPRPTPDDQLCSILTAHLKNKHHLDASFSDFFKASPRCRLQLHIRIQSCFFRLTKEADIDLGLGRRDRRI
ncbi:hypothetical protein PG987_007405 [Apiospora arundinis]